MGASCVDWKLKKLSFWSAIFSSRQQRGTILDLTVTWDEKWILYKNQWKPDKRLDWEEASKPFPKSNLHQKMLMVICCWSDPLQFLNPGKTIISEKYAQQIDEMNRKLQCPQPPLVKRKGPILHDSTRPQVIKHRELQKLNELGYKALPHAPRSPDFLPADYHLFKHFNNFLQGKCFYNQQETENVFQEFMESRSGF